MRRTSIEGSRPALPAVILAAFLAAGVSGQEPGEGPGEGPPAQVSVPALIAEMADRAASRRDRVPAWTLETRSSRERAPGADRLGPPERRRTIEDYSGRVWPVLCELEGPGAIVRLHVDRCEGDLVVFLDDDQLPAIKMPAKLIARGDIELFGPPFSSAGGEALTLRFPLPFARRAVIAMDDADSGWELDWRRYRADVTVEPFRVKPAYYATFGLQGEIGALRGALAPSEKRRVLDAAIVHGPADVTLDLDPGAVGTILEREVEGPHQIVRLVYEDFLPFETLQALEGLVLEASFDGKDTASVSLADLFGEGESFAERLGWWVRKESLYNGVMRRRTLEMPMPFASSAALRLRNRGPIGVRALRFFFEVGKREDGAAGGAWHATARSKKVAFESARVPVPLFRAPETARLVGTTLRLSGEVGPLEGSLRIRAAGGGEAPARLLSGSLLASAGAARSAEPASHLGFLDAASTGASGGLLLRERILDVVELKAGDVLEAELLWGGGAEASVRSCVLWYGR